MKQRACARTQDLSKLKESPIKRTLDVENISSSISYHLTQRTDFLRILFRELGMFPILDFGYCLLGQKEAISHFPGVPQEISPIVSLDESVGLPGGWSSLTRPEIQKEFIIICHGGNHELSADCSNGSEAFHAEISNRDSFS
jgi:hypothetical protein